MKVAIYCRTSKREQNPENQKIKLVEYAKLKEWEYEVFEEQESTRKTRPVKEQVLAAIRKGKFNGVLIYKLDRWARSLQELIMNVEEITNRGKEFIVLTQPFDTTSSAGKLMMQILGAFAEFEREIIRERTLVGLERARASGKKLGRPRKFKDKYRRSKMSDWTKRKNNIRIETKKTKKRDEKCFECGSQEHLEFHHPDYDEPNKTITLCRKCHLNTHGKNGGM